jgi:hypothetical protein
MACEAWSGRGIDHYYDRNCIHDNRSLGRNDPVAINKYVAANPQWFMLEVFDGFGAHLASLPAMQERFDNKSFP